jgi:hypothetical protein
LPTDSVIVDHAVFALNLFSTIQYARPLRTDPCPDINEKRPEELVL